MADSHGHDETIASAISFLRGHRCRRIYHLGDICDSIKPSTVEHCVSLLHENRILAIKGNNDHVVAVNHKDGRRLPFSKDTLEYLKQLPMIRHDQGACLTHSLPFAERGLSSMIGTMGETEIRLFFNNNPPPLLFRGHGHMPEVVWMDQKDIRRYPLKKGDVFDLKGKMPCIVTCGALTRGLCMIWQPQSEKIECNEYG